MLEWSLRKIFGIKKPPSRKEQAKTTREALENEAKTTELSVAGERVEPILGDDNGRDLATQNGADAGNGLSASVPGEMRPVEGAPAPVVRPVAAEKETKVHIFNFKAWFYADPVKAALTIGLAFLSWLATYTGMLELIQANTGSLDIGSRLAIGFAVMMLMLMILYLLDSLYSGGTPTWLKPVFVFGYLFLTLISVGFGFGFYWKYLEAQTEATRSAESAVSQVQVALQIGQSRLEQLQSTFAQLTTLSAKKATQEREHGNSCPNSSPGEGPRMRLRDSDSQKFAYAAEYITGRATSVKGDLTALNADLKKVVTRDGSTVGKDGTRNKFLRSLGRKLDLTIARFNTLRTDPQLRQFRDSFDKRASTTVFPKGGGRTFRCPDVQLQTALRGVVRAIDDIPEIKNPKISAVEGSEAIVEAFRRLAVTLAALPTLKLPPSADELRKARKAALSAGRKVEVSNIDPGLSKRDYIPLSAAVFVDLCILLISLNRRYDNFEKLQTSVASAEAGEIGNTVLKIFEAHKNKISEEMLEIFHHAEFEHGRDYYLAVPLIKGSKKALIHQRLHAKQQQTIRSQHETLDHKINLLDEKLQNLVLERTEQERRKLQLTNELNKLVSAENRIIEQIKQKFLAYQGETPEQMAERHDMVSLDGRRQIVLQNINQNKSELEKHGRVMAGNLQRADQIKNEVVHLKEQRTTIHKEEERVLQGQLESTVEHDLAKEARFLSNLCISLEANNILHLASIYPFQRTVRNELKKHNSRYYAEGRNYRVYRFRKVADTQSQMVLDLIMEASRRARANGEFETEDESEKLTGMPDLVEVPFNEPKQTTRESDVEELRELLVSFKQEAAEFKLEAASLKQDAANKQAEIEKLREEGSRPSTSPIDHDAPDLEPLRVLSPEEQRSMNKGLGRQLTGVAGLGVAAHDLANLGKEKRIKTVEPTEPTVGQAAALRPVAPKVIQEKLASYFTKEDVTPSTVTAEVDGPKASPVVDPGESVPSLGDTKTGHEEADQEVSFAHEPFVATAPEPVNLPEPEPEKMDDFRQGVNEDSLLPSTLKGIEQDSFESPDVGLDRTPPEIEAPVSRSEEVEPQMVVAQVEEPRATEPRIAETETTEHQTAEPQEIVPPVFKTPATQAQQTVDTDVEPDLPQRPKLQDLTDRVRKLDEKNGDKVAAIGHLIAGEEEAPANDESHALTDPVILSARDANQDLAGERPPVTLAKEDDEPSEVESVEWGDTPSMFASKNTVFDEVSEDLKARRLAARFRPDTDDK